MAESNLPSPSPSEGRALSKAEMAWTMKEAGWSLSEIATELDLRDGQSVIRLLKDQYERDVAFMSEDSRYLILGMQFGRLEKLIRANMPSAELGDPKSADIVLKAMNMENQLAKLGETTSSEQAKVLVVGGAEVEYVEALKNKVEEN